MNEKVPPSNSEAEQAILGALLLEGSAVIKISDLLCPEDFYYQSHQVIYKTILQLYSSHKPVDLITLSDSLSKNDLLQQIGGRLYIADLINTTISSANIEHYANIVKEKSILRNLLSLCSEISSKIFDNHISPDQLIELAQKNVFALANKNTYKSFFKLNATLDNVLEMLSNKEKLNTSCIKSGYLDLDRITGGFTPGDLIILAARPSMGKTALALNIASNVSRLGQAVAVFSLEMPKESLMLRILCSEAEINSESLKNENLPEEHAKKISHVLPVLDKADIYIDDSATLNTVEIRAKARKLKLETDIKLIVIDYLQLINGHDANLNRTQEVGMMTRELKAMGKELNVPIILLSQLSRNLEYRNSKIPLLADLRDSGEIEQNADLVIFIHRDEYYDEYTENKNIAKIVIAKHRNGATGSIELAFRKEFTKFLNLSKQNFPQ